MALNFGSFKSKLFDDTVFYSRLSRQSIAVIPLGTSCTALYVNVKAYAPTVGLRVLGYEICVSGSNHNGTTPNIYFITTNTTKATTLAQSSTVALASGATGSLSYFFTEEEISINDTIQFGVIATLGNYGSAAGGTLEAMIQLTVSTIFEMQIEAG